MKIRERKGTPFLFHFYESHHTMVLLRSNGIGGTSEISHEDGYV